MRGGGGCGGWGGRGGLGKMIPVRGWQTRGPFEEVSACGELASPLGSVLSRILRTKWSKTPKHKVFPPSARPESDIVS